MKNKGLSCSREKIIVGVWGYDFDGEEKLWMCILIHLEK